MDIHQFPYWNEPQRMLGLTPRYLAWGTPGSPQIYACVLTTGPAWAKVGLVFRGPCSLERGQSISRSALEDLMEWAYTQSYCFLRFTSADEHTSRHLAALPYAYGKDAFPFFQDFSVSSPDYLVEQHPNEEDTLATFDREVRRKLRRADETGYEFRAHNSPLDLEHLWPMFLESARQKQFHLERPLRFYQELMSQAAACDAVRLYTVQLRDEAVGAALVLRDGRTAHCHLAAFAPAHRQSAAFLHWRAMRDMYAQGASHYNLGPGPGTLAHFKQQFVRQPQAAPRAITVVLHEEYFRIWSQMLLPLVTRVRPWLRGLACRSYRLL